MTGETVLWLVRHGESESSAARLVAGWSDPPLTERGREQARVLAPRLAGRDFAGVWSSDLRRAVETARLAWGEPSPDRRLREVSFGELEGRPYDEAEARCPQALISFRDFAPPGGECEAEVLARLESFLTDLSGGVHLVVTHGGVIRLLTRDDGLDRFLPTCSVVVLGATSRRVLELYEGGAAAPGE